jgi:hypothetical protein
VAQLTVAQWPGVMAEVNGKLVTIAQWRENGGEVTSGEWQWQWHDNRKVGSGGNSEKQWRSNSNSNEINSEQWQ